MGTRRREFQNFLLPQSFLSRKHLSCAHSLLLLTKILKILSRNSALMGGLPSTWAPRAHTSPAAIGLGCPLAPGHSAEGLKAQDTNSEFSLEAGKGNSLFSVCHSPVRFWVEMTFSLLRMFEVSAAPRLE